MHFTNHAAAAQPTGSRTDAQAQEHRQIRAKEDFRSAAHINLIRARFIAVDDRRFAEQPVVPTVFGDSL